ncbi:hypothetical protein ASG22_03075 [Chryseobacterium sp. Leaf405]|nr:hypothetical protein ASG22_03075 [Chryseobacterium sp. Leaf405]
MKRFIHILSLLIFTTITFKSQNRSDNPLLFQAWKFKKLGFLSSNFEKSKHLDKKNLSFKLKKNGKLIANWIENG